MPRDLCHLKNLEEFSLDWLKYTNPPMEERVNQAPHIHAILNFLRNYQSITNKLWLISDNKMLCEVKLDQSGNLIDLEDSDRDQRSEMLSQYNDENHHTNPTSILQQPQQLHHDRINEQAGKDPDSAD